MGHYEGTEPWEKGVAPGGCVQTPRDLMRSPWETSLPDCGMPGSDPEREYDPMGDMKSTNPKDSAATYRLDLSLFPATGVVYGALGMTEGHCKYGAYNYRVMGIQASTYIAAMKRHIAQYESGEYEDPKTGVPHLGSILADAAILADGHELGIIMDDRPPRMDMQGLLTRFMAKVKHLYELFPNSPGRYTEKQHGLKRRSTEEERREAVGRDIADLRGERLDKLVEQVRRA